MQMYFVAVILPEHLNRRILIFKNYLRDKYGCRVALRSPAHITIIPPYWMDTALESSLVADIDIISSNLSPCIITTNNFDVFAPRTIFIATKPNEQLSKINEQVNRFFSEKTGYKMKPGTRPFHPHITVATRDI